MEECKSEYIHPIHSNLLILMRSIVLENIVDLNPYKLVIAHINIKSLRNKFDLL